MTTEMKWGVSYVDEVSVSTTARVRAFNPPHVGITPSFSLVHYQPSFHPQQLNWTETRRWLFSANLCVFLSKRFSIFPWLFWFTFSLTIFNYMKNSLKIDINFEERAGQFLTWRSKLSLEIDLNFGERQGRHQNSWIKFTLISRFFQGF